MLGISHSDLSDVILLCGVNIKRNYADIPFTAKLGEEDAASLREEVLSALNAKFSGIRLEKTMVAETDAMSLTEMCEDMCFYSSDEDEDTKALRVALTSGTKLSVCINRGDHLSFSAFIRDSDIKRVPGIIKPMESALKREKDYAFDHNWGYLTSSVKYTGNAMVGMYLMSLTGLCRMNLIGEEIENLKQKHIELKPLFGDEDSECELYCMYSTVQLGKSASDVLSDLEKMAQDLVYRERNAREELIYDDTDEFADSVMRAFGILMNARLMGFGEFLSLYSDVRAGLANGFVEGSIKELDDIAMELSPEEIRKNYKDLTDRDEELLRADICRRRFSESIKTIKI